MNTRGTGPRAPVAPAPEKWYKNGMNPSATLLRGTPVLLVALAALLILCGGPPPAARAAGAPADGPHRQTGWIARKQPQKDGESRPPEEGRPSAGRETPAPAGGKGGKASSPAPTKPFTPSEKIRPGQAVDFPTDI